MGKNHADTMKTNKKRKEEEEEETTGKNLYQSLFCSDRLLSERDKRFQSKQPIDRTYIISSTATDKGPVLR